MLLFKSLLICLIHACSICQGISAVKGVESKNRERKKFTWEKLRQRLEKILLLALEMVWFSELFVEIRGLSLYTSVFSMHNCSERRCKN